MFRKLAFIIAIIIVGLGVLFIVLNFLDIDEDYRLQLPIAELNTVFISAVAVSVACLAARTFSNTGSFEMLGLGGAALAFGIGILIYGWFAHAVLDVRIGVYDTSYLIATVMHLCGAILLKLKLNISVLKSRQKLVIILLSYVAVIVVIAIITWLLYRNVLPSTITSRDWFHVISAVLALAAAGIYLKTYLNSRNPFYYWYSLGLVLMTLGLIIYSQGALQSRVAWLGRVAQYVGGIYFLVAVLGARLRLKKQEAE